MSNQFYPVLSSVFLKFFGSLLPQGSFFYPHYAICPISYHTPFKYALYPLTIPPLCRWNVESNNDRMTAVKNQTDNKGYL